VDEGQGLNLYDVVVAGGGTAGLSAALVLGRSRISCLICNGGEVRNATAPEIHNYLSREGLSPQEFLKIGREQIANYPSVEFSEDLVAAAVAEDNSFRIELASGRPVLAKKLILATGLEDEIPLIEGMRERWGISVLHCPFCHGWESRDLAWAVYGNNGKAVDLCLMAKGWTDRITLCTDGVAELTAAQRKTLRACGIAVRESRVVRLEGDETSLERMIFEDGEDLECQAVFLRPVKKQRSVIPNSLGCAVNADGLILVDENGATTAQGVFAAGDATEPVLQVLAYAAFSGVRAGIGAAKSLFSERFA